MICEVCEQDFMGVKCRCGWEPKKAQSERQVDRRWNLCSWTRPNGTCQLPASCGTLTQGLHLDYLCAWHRDWDRFYKGSMSPGQVEEQVFHEWRSQFEKTDIQPFPGIWHMPEMLLWALCSGAMQWNARHGANKFLPEVLKR